MPPCVCGAREFLCRTKDNPGNHAYFVNSLHEHLVKLGQIHENVKERLTAEKEEDKPTNRGILTDTPLEDLVMPTTPEPFDPAKFLEQYK